jgi:two-component system chemotaxis sensor kinase CheA
MDELLKDFLAETNERLDTVDVSLVSFERDPGNADILASIFRLVHTVKGTCGFIGLPRLERLSHAAETLLGQFRDGRPVTAEAVSLVLSTIDRIKQILQGLETGGAEPPGGDDDLIVALDAMVAGRPAAVPPPPAEAPERAPAPAGTMPQRARALAEPPAAGQTPADERAGGQAASIRVALPTLEHLMAMVSELVLTRNQLLDIARRSSDEAFKGPLQRLSHITAELQDGVMKTRMQPIAQLWKRFPRYLRDIGAELGKSVELRLAGAETELDRQVLDLIRDPLTHMIRNAVDHGIEPPHDRVARGKLAHGTISLSAWHEGGTITIEMSDDGRGIDLAAVRRRAAERGLAGEAELERHTDAQLAKFIFHPGFSTAVAVSTLSGRGVGMDVVKTNVEEIGGSVAVRTVPGQGTTFTIKIPLTLAIVTALLVESAGLRFAIPQAAVQEIVRVGEGADSRMEQVQGAPVIRLRERLLPVVRLSGLLGLADAGQAPGSGLVIVMKLGSFSFGLGVDGVFHAEEIVVKPLCARLRRIPFFSGNTILGDGSVILIVDPNAVARVLGAEDLQSAALAGAGEEAAEDEETGSRLPLLVFRAGPGAPKAVPLSLVSRLEEFEVGEVQRDGERVVVPYGGGLMRLIPARPDVSPRESGRQPVLVFAIEGRQCGVMVDAIVDIVDETLTISLPEQDGELIGSAIVRGRPTDILDVAALMARAGFAGPPRPAERKPRLLVVEPAEFFRDLIRPMLTAAGYGVDCAADIGEARTRLAVERRYAAAILDLDHAAGSEAGLALLREGLSGPVLGTASDVAGPAARAALAAGVARVVGKFDRRGLIAALSDRLGSREIAA